MSSDKHHAKAALLVSQFYRQNKLLLCNVSTKLYGGN